VFRGGTLDVVDAPERIFLEPGVRIGTYVVQRLVAVGGSSEVYSAENSVDGAVVAIKLLHASFGADPDRRRRFKEEAAAYARLSHPRIVALLDAGEYNNRPYLVMEWIEGATLAEKLAAGPLPAEEAVRIMTEVAEGLASAHVLGLAHRDLKPANIMIMPSGSVKLLDFGLAKPVPGAGGKQRSWVTDDGAIVGTPEYMSPEQVSGKEVHLSSDVFAFGTVFCEALSGKSPFRRPTILETLNAVAECWPPRIPNITLLNGNRIRSLIRRCLAADPERRPGDAMELMVELRRAGTPDGVLRTRLSRWYRPVLLGGFLATVAATMVILVINSSRNHPTKGPPGAMGMSTLTIDGRLPRLDPSGGFVVYCSHNGQELLRAPISHGSPLLLRTGRGFMRNPCITSDGQWVLFDARDSEGRTWVWEIPASGGPARRVSRGWGPAVSPDDGVIACVDDVGTGNFEIIVSRRDSSDRRPVCRLPGGLVPLSLAFGAGSDIVFVTLTDGVRRAVLAGISLDTGRFRTIAELEGVPSLGLFISTRHEVALWCVRFSAAGAHLLGATSLIRGGFSVVYPGPCMISSPSISETADTLLVEATRGPQQFLETVVDPVRNVAATSFHTINGTEGGGQPRISPDGMQIAFQSSQGEIWILDRRTGTSAPLMRTGESAFNPAWSPDGKLVAYSCLEKGNSRLWVAGSDGSEPRRLTVGPGSDYQPVWHPDGKHILFISTREGPEELYVLDTSDRSIRRISSGGAVNPAISPDGDAIAYVRQRTDGKSVLRLQDLDPGIVPGHVIWEHAVEVSPIAGAKPRFSPDGRWIAFDQPSGPAGADIWILPIDAGVSEAPRRLTVLPFPATMLGWFDWGPENTMIIAASRAEHRFLLLGQADRWIRRALQ